jgi:hypothetical protein
MVETFMRKVKTSLLKLTGIQFLSIYSCCVQQVRSGSYGSRILCFFYIFSASFVRRSTNILSGKEAGEAKRSEKFEAKRSEKKRKNWFFVFA